MEFIGIDIGSQAAKLTLLTEKGEPVAEEHFSYPIDYPKPYWAEQAPGNWEEAVLKGLKNIASRSKNPAEIVSIGIAAQVDGVVPIDRAGKPLYKAIIWMDRRAIEEEKWIEKVIGREIIFPITGCNLDASHVLPKILWLKRNTESVAKTWKFLMPASYLLFFLTGSFGLDYSNASSTLFYNVKEKVWCKDILKEFDLDLSLLPEIFPSTHSAGKLKKAIADSVGLTNRPVVAVGSGDEHAACIGAGVIEEGIALDIAGTAEVVGASSSLPLLDNSRLIETHGHASPDHWLLENPGFVSGGNLRWFRDNICSIKDCKLSFDELTKAAKDIPPGSDGLIFLPTLMGAMAPEWNSKAKGNIYGLSLNSTSAHITKAILEASAYGIKDVIEAFKNMGLRFEKVRITGGGSQSEIWNQIKADVLNISVETLFTPETTSFGAALIGAVACKAFTSLKTAAARTVKIRDIIRPQAERAVEVYKKMYQLYRDLYYTLKPFFNK
ncbi:MAG: FGGY family carbohydrate kinase [Spirochaetota bacterium]